MRAYIESNALRRKKARSKVESDLYKKLNNVIYGAQLHDRSRHVDAEIVMGQLRLAELVRKPQFKNFIEFSSQTGLVIKRKRKILQTNCTPIAFGILSVSKLILLRNYYNVLLPALRRSGAETITCYSDTGTVGCV